MCLYTHTQKQKGKKEYKVKYKSSLTSASSHVVSLSRVATVSHMFSTVSYVFV